MDDSTRQTSTARNGEEEMADPSQIDFYAFGGGNE
jgi:hypothetical protein